jgi:hypothetical protein
MSYAMGERICFSRTRSCNNEKRLNTVLDGMALCRVQLIEIRLSHWFLPESQNSTSNHAFLVSRNGLCELSG